MRTTANRQGIFGIIAVLAVFGVFLVLVWKLGFLGFTGSDSSATIVASAIALVGTLLGTLITAIGLLLKHSLDLRAEQRLHLEEQRNAELKRESENRLRLEAAIRAVQLMGATKDQPDPSVQRAGALFSLASLGQYELTLSLSQLLFDRDEIDANTLSNVFDAMLRTCSEEVQERMISGLVDRADRLVTPLGVALPQLLIDRPDQLSSYSRRWLPVLIGRIIAVRPIADWQPLKFQLYALISALCIAWIEEKESYIKNGIAAVLIRVLRGYDGPPILYHPRQMVDVDNLGTQLSDGAGHGDEINQLVSLLDRWLERNSVSAPSAATLKG